MAPVHGTGLAPSACRVGISPDVASRFPYGSTRTETKGRRAGYCARQLGAYKALPSTSGTTRHTTQRLSCRASRRSSRSHHVRNQCVPTAASGECVTLCFPPGQGTGNSHDLNVERASTQRVRGETMTLAEALLAGEVAPPTSGMLLTMSITSIARILDDFGWGQSRRVF